MSDDTLPPVGATVTDARGYAWRMSDDRRWHWIIGSGLEIAGGVPPSDHDAALTALWRMQQERDHQANRAEEAEAAWTEEKQDNIRLRARVAELEKEVAFSNRRFDALEELLAALVQLAPKEEKP